MMCRWWLHWPLLSPVSVCVIYPSQSFKDRIQCVSLLNMTQHWASNNCNRIRYVSWSIISYNFCIGQGHHLWFMDGKCTQHMENTYCLSLLCCYCLLEKYWLWKNMMLLNIIVPAKGLTVSHCTLTFGFNHMCPICVWCWMHCKCPLHLWALWVCVCRALVSRWWSCRCVDVICQQMFLVNACQFFIFIFFFN